MVRHHQRGAALLLVVALILILGASTLIVRQLQFVQRTTDRATTTKQRLLAVENAMARFVSVNRRLPCPADGRTSSTAVGAGTEQRLTGDCTLPDFGVLPWVALQLVEQDVTDGWGGRFTYRVPTGATGFTRDGAFNMSSCATAGSAVAESIGSVIVCRARTTFPCPLASECTSPANYLVNRGLMVRDGTGVILMNPATNTGAAYVVISAGENRGGAFLPVGVIATTEGTALGNGETINRNNQAAQANYVDAIRDTSATATHFDDLILRPTITSVLSAASLGPRP